MMPTQAEALFVGDEVMNKTYGKMLNPCGD